MANKKDQPTVKVFSPDGKCEEQTVPNARDLVAHAGWTYESPEVKKVEAEAQLAAIAAADKARNEASDSVKKDAEAAKAQADKEAEAEAEKEKALKTVSPAVDADAAQDELLGSKKKSGSSKK
jgi:hypothetical protein